MSQLLYPDFFNNVFGPIMQPGSSDCFAGTARIGNIARALAKGHPKKVRFLFNRRGNGLAYLVNFMSDKGYLGGVQGFLPEDERLFEAHTLARQNDLFYDFNFLETENVYDDSVQIDIETAKGEKVTLTATSIGGGMIITHEINGFKIEWQSDTYGVLIEDDTNSITDTQIEQLKESLGDALVDSNKLYKEKNITGYFLELSREVPEDTFYLNISRSNTIRISRLPALMPVITKKDKKPQLFKTVDEWRQVAQERRISFVQAAIEYEKDSSGWSEQEIWDFFENIADILYQQIHSLEKIGYENAKDTSLLPVYGKNWNEYLKKGIKLSDDLTNHIIIHALSTNAKLPGVKIVPAPMGTGGGYLFSALDAVREKKGYSHEKLIEALIVAAALGAIAYTHTNASGNVGCVGESGICCAMAAGAVTWIAGGDGKQVENAASMALQANIGIPCDPISGGLEFPCITRTIRAAVTAPLYADLSLSGIDPLIPYHELLILIEQNYRTSDKTKLSGSKCGCNLTPTAGKCQAWLEGVSLELLHYADDKGSVRP